MTQRPYHYSAPRPERLRASPEQLASYAAAHQGDGGTMLAPIGGALHVVSAGALGPVLGGVPGGEATNPKGETSTEKGGFNA
jgi:hypothetical protein